MTSAASIVVKRVVLAMNNQPQDLIRDQAMSDDVLQNNARSFNSARSRRYHHFIQPGPAYRSGHGASFSYEHIGLSLATRRIDDSQFRFGVPLSEVAGSTRTTSGVPWQRSSAH